MSQLALMRPHIKRRDLGLRFWLEGGRFDPRGALLADGHYSRRKPGSPQFMPPGQKIILISRDERAVFGWWRPHPDSGIKAMNGLDGWTCSIFRNSNPRPSESSEMILDAERAFAAVGYGCGPSGLLTYVWDAKVRSANPGYCFKQAGWHTAGRRHACCRHMPHRSADGRKTLLHKPFNQAGIGRHE